MKIIVTGCRGQLGTEIIKQLREGRSELGPIPEKLVSATVIPVDLPELDITNYKMVDDFIRRQRPDRMIPFIFVHSLYYEIKKLCSLYKARQRIRRVLYGFKAELRPL